MSKEYTVYAAPPTRPGQMKSKHNGNMTGWFCWHLTCNTKVPNTAKSESFLWLSRNVSKCVKDTGEGPQATAHCSKYGIFDCGDWCPMQSITLDSGERIGRRQLALSKWTVCSQECSGGHVERSWKSNIPSKLQPPPFQRKLHDICVMRQQMIRKVETHPGDI